jgi:hypothetical protein
MPVMEILLLVLKGMAFVFLVVAGMIVVLVFMALLMGMHRRGGRMPVPANRPRRPRSE